MNSEHLERIEEDYMYLSVSMRENIKRLVKYLAEKKTIDSTQEEDIMDEASDTLKSQTLLDYLLKMNEEAFTNFYEGCLHSHMWKAADILEPEKGPHKPKEEEIEEFLPENWPTESHYDMIKDPQTLRIKRIGPRHTQMMGCFEESKSTKADSAYYNMSNKVKGRVLVVNNEQFDHFPERKGSNYDRAGLDYVFSQLSFEIRVEQNLTAAKLKEVLNDEAERDHSTYNCFVLAILSYGLGGEQVLGTDAKVVNNSKAENYMEFEEIKRIFARVPSLANKPKVFLIEAEDIKSGRFRRGGNTGQRSSSQASSGSQSGNTQSDSSFGMDFEHNLLSKLEQPNVEINKAMEIMKKTLSDGLIDGFGDTETDEPTRSTPGTAVKTVPLKGDIFSAVAKFKERLTHKSEPCGSWFIQAFIYIVANYAHQNDLQMIIQKINDLTVHQKGISSDQVCSAVSTLNKKLFFFPGLPIDA